MLMNHISKVRLSIDVLTKYPKSLMMRLFPSDV